MNVFVFLGPTLALDQARRVLDATYLPPASQGDVCRLLPRHPRAVAIVDGAFEHVPAVWHKEILLALHEGVPVYGAASMGALRAAELDVFGMVGVGRIYEAFRDGVLEADDEVAVAHGPRSAGYAPLNEALVSIRATLERAEREGILAPAARRHLEEVARELHYPLRNYPAILAAAAGRVDAAALAAFRAWIPGGRVDQKAADAIEMLDRLAGDLAADRRPALPSFHLERTTYLQRLLDAPAVPDDPDSPVPFERIAEEALLQGNLLAQVRRGILLRMLLLAEADRRRVPTGGPAAAEILSRFCRARGLDPADLPGWLAANDIPSDMWERWMREERRLAAMLAVLEADVRERLPEYLRLTGDYGPLRDRAAAKARKLDAIFREGVEPPDGLALAWYFGRLDRPVPGDLATYAVDAGFRDVPELLRAVRREYLYAAENPR